MTKKLLATLLMLAWFDVSVLAQNAPDVHLGLVQIQSTAATALDVSGGITVGTGDVALVGTDGKINGPLSSTIIDDLSAANLTSIPAAQLTGTISIARFPTGGTWTLSSDLTLSSGGDFVALGTGPHAIGGAAVDYVQLLLPGSFSSGGASTSASIIKVSGALVGHSGDSDGLSYFRLSPTSSTINGSATTVATLYVDEPGLIETSGAATNAATVYISGAATEATSNYALLVDAGASRLDGTLSVGAGSVGSPGIMMDEDTDTGVFHPGANRLAVSTAGTSRMEWAAGGLVTVGAETANGNMTVGLTINQAANDNQIFALKSSDISTGLTSGVSSGAVEVDDFFTIQKHSATAGGVRINVMAETGTVDAFSIEVTSGAPQTTDATNSFGQINFLVLEHDGSNGRNTMAATSNMVMMGAVDSSNATTARFILKADGVLHLGNTTLVALDAHEDAMAVRGLQYLHAAGLPAGGGIIPTAYDEGRMSYEKLFDLGVVGERDDDGQSLFSVQRYLGLHDGAIFQNYATGQDTRELVERSQRRVADLESTLDAVRVELAQLRSDYGKQDSPRRVAAAGR